MTSHVIVANISGHVRCRKTGEAMIVEARMIIDDCKGWCRFVATIQNGVNAFLELGIAMPAFVNRPLVELSLMLPNVYQVGLL